MTEKMKATALDGQQMLKNGEEMDETQRTSGMTRTGTLLMATLCVAMLTLICGLTLIFPNQVQAWPGKETNCTNSCHSAVDTDATISTFIDGVATTSISDVANDGNGSFEIDYFFSNINDTGLGVGVQVALPSGWGIAPGTGAYSPAGWNSAWDAASGVGWSAVFGMSQYATEPDGYTINYGGSAWDTGSGGRGNRNAACDEGLASCVEGGSDQDLTLSTMGADLLVTVPNGTTPGQYNIRVFGVGHDGALAKAYVEQVITVNVTGGANSAPTLTVNQPDGIGDSVTEGSTFNINYDLADAEQAVTVAFYYDDNNSGLDGVAAANCSAAPEGTGVNCAWDTNGVTPGDYFIYGITDDGIAAQVSAYSSGTVTVNAAGGPDSLVVTSNTTLANSAVEGNIDVLMQRLEVNCTAGGGDDGICEIVEITIDDIGDAESPDINFMNIYIDTDTTFDANDPNRVDNTPFNGTAQNIGLTSIPLADRQVTAGTPKYIWVTYDLDAGSAGITVQSSVTAVAVNTGSGDTGASGTWNSNSFTITAGGGPDSLSVTTNTPLASFATEGDTDVQMQRLDVSCTSGGGDDGICEITGITVDDLGSVTGTEIDNLNIYIDTDTNFAGTEPKIADATFAGTSQAISLISLPTVDRQVTAGTPKYIWVTYDLAAGSAPQTVQTSVTAVDVNTGSGDTGATGTWNSNGFAISAIGSGLSCSGCHNYPPLDGTRDGSTGAVVGDHRTPAHLAATCDYCHVVPATETSADAGHRNGDIEMKDGTIGDAGSGDNGSYSKGATFAQSNSPTTGTCSNIDCHNNAVTPQWGVGIIDHVARSYATGGATPCMNCHDDSASGANWTVVTTHLDDCTICHTTIPALQGGLVAGVCTGCHTNTWAVTHTTNTPDHTSLVTVSGTTAGWTNCGNCHSDPPPLVDNVDLKVHNVCGTCHDVDGGLVTTLGTNNQNFTTGGNCETCHGTVDTSATFSSTHTTHTSAHAVALDTVNDLSNGQHCGNCHVVSSWTEIEGTEHNVATNGAGSCATCHNSPTQTVIDIIADVSTVGGTANCLDCHTDKTVAHGSADHTTLGYVTLGSNTCDNCHDLGVAANGTVETTHLNNCSLCHTTVPALQPGIPAGGGSCDVCHTDTWDVTHTTNTPDHTTLVTVTGTTDCGTCHSTPPPLVDNADPKVHNACGSCHDANGSLISTAIGKDFTTGGNCETCHGATWDTIHTTAPDHTSLVQVATTDCASCHSTPPPLVDNADPKVHNACASCHDATSGALISSAIGKDFTTGGDCTTCHGTAWESLHFTNNNGTTTHNSLVTVTATTAGWTNCASCHSDPPPLTDGADAKVHNACASCHATNGSRVSTAVGKDFTTGGNCETCHGTVADSTAFASTHTTHTASHTVSVGGDQSNGQLCSNCHVVSTWAEIEGTEHNVATNGAGSCATCHNSSTQTVIDVIAAGAATTCLDCHTDKTAAHGSVDHVATTYVTVGGTQEYYGTTCASCHDPGGAENATVDVTHGGDCSLCHTTVPNLQPGLPTGGGPNDCVNCHTGGVHTLWGRFQDTCAGDYGPESCHATFQGPGTSVHDAHNVNWDTPADDEIDRANATVGVDDQPMVFPYGTAPDYWQPNWPLTPTCGTCHTSYLNPLVTADGVGCNVCHKFKTNKKEFMHTYHEGDMAIDCQYCHYND